MCVLLQERNPDRTGRESAAENGGNPSRVMNMKASVIRLWGMIFPQGLISRHQT